MELLCSITFSFAISSLISFTVSGMHPENVLPSPSRCSKPYGNIQGSRRYLQVLTADPVSLLSYRTQPHPVPELSETYRKFRPGVRSQIPYRSGLQKEYLHFSHILTGLRYRTDNLPPPAESGMPGSYGRYHGISVLTYLRWFPPHYSSVTLPHNRFSLPEGTVIC